MAITTLNPLAPGAGDQQEVKPILKTWAQLKDARDAGNLIPGQYYRIADYVTTVNGATITNARSAGHPFDILVRADSANTLNEQAWAVRHDGDTYFEGARLEAWELKYRLDNVQWSKQAGTYVTDEENGYTFQVVGDITLSGHTYKLLQGFGMYVDDWSDYALMETVAEGEQIICYYGDPEEFDPEAPEVVGTASGIEEVTEAGKGTIVYMKDEWGNEAGYDFKNIQQKRWKVTDELERDSLDGKYLGVLNSLPEKLSIEDESDFIWAYLYSVYNYEGGTQDTTDHSLTGKVHGVVTNFTVDNNNAFVWENDDNEAYKCTFSGSVGNCSFSENVENCSFSGSVGNCSFSGDVYQSTFSGSVRNCSFSGYVYWNTFSGSVGNCSFSGYVRRCSFSGYVENCSFSGSVGNCSFSGYVGKCSFSGNVRVCSFSGSVGNCSFSGDVYQSTFSGNVESCSFSGSVNNSIISGQLNSLQINASSGASGIINGLYTLGKIDSKTITVTANAAYPTYAAMTTAGQLKTWNPAD